MRRIREEEERVSKEDEERRRVQHGAKRAMDRERVRPAAFRGEAAVMTAAALIDTPGAGTADARAA